MNVISAPASASDPAHITPPITPLLQHSTPLLPRSTRPVPISALAALLGCTRATIRHFADRLGFRFTATRMGARHKRVACLAPEHAAAIAAEVERDAASSPSSSSLSSSPGTSARGAASSSEAWPGSGPTRQAITKDQELRTKNRRDRDHGVIYLLQLEPEFDPGRFKLGFSCDLEGRIDDLLTVAPLARLIAAWPACRSWERIAIVSIAQTAEPLSQEVFRCDRLEHVIAAAERFFAVMPRLDGAAPPAAERTHSAPAAEPTGITPQNTQSPRPAAQSPPAIPEREPPNPPPLHLSDAAVLSAPEAPPGITRSSQRSDTSGLAPSQRPPSGAIAENLRYAPGTLIYESPP